MPLATLPYNVLCNASGNPFQHESYSSSTGFVETGKKKKRPMNKVHRASPSPSPPL